MGRLYPPINSRVFRSCGLSQDIHQSEPLILHHMIFLGYFFQPIKGLRIKIVKYVAFLLVAPSSNQKKVNCIVLMQ